MSCSAYAVFFIFAVTHAFTSSSSFLSLLLFNEIQYNRKILLAEGETPRKERKKR
jgi:hypothetical protein